MAASSSLQIYSSSLFNPYKKSSKNSNAGRCLQVYNVIKLDKSASFICCASKKRNGFMDQILDYIEGGPKLRKWYGAEKLPKDGGDVEDGEDDDTQEVEQVRDAVLVTDGDSEIGQMVILSLIVARARVKAIVKDKRAAIEAFGTYVESITGDVNDPPFLKKTLKGVRSIICPSSEIFFSDIGRLEGVQHIVLLSQLAVYRGSDGIQALIQSNAKKLAEKNESRVMNSSNKIPYTIIRAGLLQDTQGGQQGFNFKEGSAEQGKLSKEDAAFICVEALNAVPKRGLVVEVANGKETVSDWKELFSNWIQNADEEQLQ
ncbi:uncharacterized protein At2g37660, chloroplastic-like [Papaver somniferum]|uniref:uncharacterized protein At2g37660, chloroplastic-like n=1 Tax=Papaver somniferum TaxID=3469 RepID=UPI000E6FE345|nr:uncharacterized protein At2g37660, chloroplastic-like [Papaver somniferum]